MRQQFGFDADKLDGMKFRRVRRSRTDIPCRQTDHGRHLDSLNGLHGGWIRVLGQRNARQQQAWTIAGQVGQLVLECAVAHMARSIGILPLR